MAEIEVDYLVVGAGASGMAFADALVTAGARSRCCSSTGDTSGGHWLDAYPFVRLHQPSANYGVTPLGSATSASTCRAQRRVLRAGDRRRDRRLLRRVLEEILLPAGVRFLGMVEHRGGRGRPITP